MTEIFPNIIFSKADHIFHDRKTPSKKRPENEKTNQNIMELYEKANRAYLYIKLTPNNSFGAIIITYYG